MSAAGIIEFFEAAARQSSTQADLVHHLTDAARDLGFDHVALLHHASLVSSSSTLIRLDTYPAGWAAELADRDLLGADPVHHASVRTNTGFAWRDLAQIVDLGRRERALLALAPRFGIADGFTMPANVPGEPSGSCSFAVRPGRLLPTRNLLVAEQIGAHAFRAARRLAGYPTRARRPRLSSRERQCVRLVAAGKSDWEIAAILGLSVQTIHQYVKRARAAYDVVSRAQLVACGLRDSIVSYEEAIPPYG